VYDAVLTAPEANDPSPPGIGYGLPVCSTTAAAQPTGSREASRESVEHVPADDGRPSYEDVARPEWIIEGPAGGGRDGVVIDQEDGSPELAGRDPGDQGVGEVPAVSEERSEAATAEELVGDGFGRLVPVRSGETDDGAVRGQFRRGLLGDDGGASDHVDPGRVQAPEFGQRDGRHVIRAGQQHGNAVVPRG